MPRHRHDKPIATAAATFGACNRTGVHCLRHVLFEEMIALALNFAVEVLQTVIQVIAGPSRQNFFTASLLFHSGFALIEKGGWQWCTSEWKSGRKKTVLWRQSARTISLVLNERPQRRLRALRL